MNPFKYIVIFVILFLTTSIQAQIYNRDEIQDNIKSLHTELKRLDSNLLSPDPMDFKTYEDFLKQPNTGLVRIMPREKPENANTLSNRGGGSYYSFKRKTHEYGYGSDIELETDSMSGMLSVGFAGADYGYLAMIDGDINNITIAHPAVEFLASLKIPDLISDARLEQKRSQEGVTFNEVNYKRRQRAELGKTYILRSINYSRSDLLVCFRTVRRDKDGSLILIWKILKEFDKPDLQP